MTTDPNELRSQIEDTRARLSNDVDALAYEVNPTHMVERKVDEAKAWGGRLLDRVMGSAEDVRDATTDAVGGAVDEAGKAIATAPRAVRQQAQGNPVAAGLVAFGIGLLIASAFPASRKERELAETVKEQAQPVTDQVVAAAKEVAGNLQQPAQDAVAELKDSATEAVDTVRGEGEQAVADVTEEVKSGSTNGSSYGSGS